MPTSRVVPAPESGIYRVAKGLDPFMFLPPRSPLPEQDEPVLDGNRWYDPLGEFATLYRAASAAAAFAETIARYRRSPVCWIGSTPSSTASQRASTTSTSNRRECPTTTLPTAPETHASLTGPLRPLLRRQRLRVVDRGVAFAPDRRLTRPIARHCWTLAQKPDHRDWAGLRYESRLRAG